MTRSAATKELVEPSPLQKIVLSGDRVRAAVKELNAALDEAQKLNIEVTITRDNDKSGYSYGSLPLRAKKLAFKLTRLDFKL